MEKEFHLAFADAPLFVLLFLTPVFRRFFFTAIENHGTRNRPVAPSPFLSLTPSLRLYL